MLSEIAFCLASQREAEVLEGLESIDKKAPKALTDGTALWEEEDGYVCRGPSHGGSYMDEGTSHIRIRLLPRFVSGDRLVFASCFRDCLLFACA